jgi:hypothetical protein
VAHVLWPELRYPRPLRQRVRFRQAGGARGQVEVERIVLVDLDLWLRGRGAGEQLFITDRPSRPFVASLSAKGLSRRSACQSYAHRLMLRRRSPTLEPCLPPGEGTARHAIAGSRLLLPW